MWTNHVYLTGLFVSVMLQLKIEGEEERRRDRGSMCNALRSICKSERSRAFNWQIVVTHQRQIGVRDKE